LTSLGILQEIAEWIFNFVQSQGPIFHQWGVEEKVIALISGLHSKAWCKYADSDQCIVSTTGGRQGCQLGGLMFNSSYAITLQMLHDRLGKRGVVLRLIYREGPFWCPSGGGLPDAPDQAEDAHVLDATFVDDECLILIGAPPKILRESIDMCGGHLQTPSI
jgi:hypothetical protein